MSAPANCTTSRTTIKGLLIFHKGVLRSKVMGIKYMRYLVLCSTQSQSGYKTEVLQLGNT